MFLAADTAQARLVVNAVAHQHLVPGVQFGVKVQLDLESKAVIDIFAVSRAIRRGSRVLWLQRAHQPSAFTGRIDAAQATPPSAFMSFQR